MGDQWPQDQLHSRKVLIRSWLAFWDFTDNPFAEWEASREPRLSEYFVFHPFYDEIRGDAANPRTTFVFAPRGGGKSANRVMLERSGRPQKSNSDFLAVPYTDFSLFLASKSRRLPNSVDSHVAEILKAGTAVLLETMCQQPSLIENLYPEDKGRLRYLIKTYNSALLSVRNIQRLIQHTSPQLSPQQLKEVVGAIMGQTAIPDAVSPRVAAVAKFLSALRRARSVGPKSTRNSSHHIVADYLIDLTSAINVWAVYVLVDGIDEYAQTSADLVAAFEVLKPLISDLRLLELLALAFKFFLPTEMSPWVRAHARADRLTMIELTWREDDLRQLWEQRITAFNSGGHRGLGGLCAPGLSHKVDAEILRLANGSPRNMMRLGALLFSEHCRYPAEEGSEITLDEWERALERYSELVLRSLVELSVSPLGQSEIPRLRVDVESGCVWIGAQLLKKPLTELQFKLLAFLYAQNGKVCEQRDIAESIFVHQSSVSKLVHRLRKRIEPDPSVPIYLKSSYGQGYFLDNIE